MSEIRRPRGASEWRTALGLLCRLTLAAVFVAAALPKIADPKAFAWSISYYRLVPPWGINAFALILPALELVVGLCLLLGVWIRPAALLTAMMLGVFSLAISSAIYRDLDISCGCFGAGSSRGLTASTLVLDLLWLAMASYCLVVPAQRWGLAGWWRGRRLADHESAK